MRLAIDIGGTFTDLVLEHGNELLTKKVLEHIRVIKALAMYFI